MISGRRCGTHDWVELSCPHCPNPYQTHIRYFQLALNEIDGTAKVSEFPSPFASSSSTPSEDPLNWNEKGECDWWIQDGNYFSTFILSIDICDDSFFDEAHVVQGNKKLTLKKISNRETAHPSSRKARQINRCMERTQKLTTAKSRRQASVVTPQGAFIGFYSNHVQVERFLFFKFAALPTPEPVEAADVHDLIRRWIFYEIVLNFPATFIAMMNCLRIASKTRVERCCWRRWRRRTKWSTRRGSVSVYVKATHQPPPNPLVMPNLFCADNVKILFDWNGDFNSISRIQTVRISAPTQSAPTAAVLD